MANILPGGLPSTKPLHWVLFILVVVVLAEVTGITSMIRGLAEKVTGPLKLG